MCLSVCPDKPPAHSARHCLVGSADSAWLQYIHMLCSTFQPALNLLFPNWDKTFSAVLVLSRSHPGEYVSHFQALFVDNKTWPFACFPKFSFPLHLSHLKYLVWLNPLQNSVKRRHRSSAPTQKMSLLVVECVSGIGSGGATGACGLTFPVFVFISLCLRGCGGWSLGG